MNPFFEKIDSEEKAYFLGFIIADGSVGDTNSYGSVNRLSINISIKDIEILESFKRAIEGDTINIEVYKPHEDSFGTEDMCRIQVNSIKMCSDLARYGVVPNKTGKEVFPTLNKDLMPHMIRGFLDGDGSIYLTPKPIFQFSGNYDFLNDLKDYLHLSINTSNKINPIKDCRGRKCYDLKYGSKKDLPLFYDFIYSNSSVYLSRKYNIFSSMFSQ